MSIRLHCGACRAAFLAADDRLGATVVCPKCGAEQAPHTTAAPAGGAESAWVPPPEIPPDETPPRRRWRRVVPLLLLASAVLAVAALVAWPRLRETWRPATSYASEVAASAYLQVLVDGDPAKARSLGTIDEPPAIRSFEPPRRDAGSRESVRGSFAPIAQLHAQIARKFEYDPELGRFKVRNALGPAAETLDALHDAKAKAQQDKLYEKMASGDPEDLFDAAEAFGSVFTKLAEGVLAPQKLVPTYAQLVKEATPPLPPEAERLALEYGEDRATWDALLKRPFATLKADGPFILDRVEVTSKVRDKLASAGDPPTVLRLTLTRFRLEGIDTGWKVTAARREGLDASPSRPPSQAARPAKPDPRSPGDVTP